MFSGNFKVLPIWNSFYFINLAIFGDFVAIFEKKNDFKKNFFFKIFFSNFWKSLFLSLIWRDLRNFFFLKISKKFFWKFLILKKVKFWTLISISDWLYTHKQFVSSLVIMIIQEIFMWHAYPLRTNAYEKYSLRLDTLYKTEICTQLQLARAQLARSKLVFYL